MERHFGLQRTTFVYVCVRAMMLIEVEDEGKLPSLSKVPLQRQDFWLPRCLSLVINSVSVLRSNRLQSQHRYNPREALWMLEEGADTKGRKIISKDFER